MVDRLDLVEYAAAYNFNDYYTKYFTESNLSKKCLGNLYSSQCSNIKVTRDYNADRDVLKTTFSMAGFTIQCECDDLQLALTAYKQLASMLLVFDDMLEGLLNMNLPLAFVNKSTDSNVAMGGSLYGCELPIVPMLHGTLTFAFFTKYPTAKLERADQLREPGLAEQFMQSCSICSISSGNLLGFAKIGSNGSVNTVCSYVFAQPDPRRPNVNNKQNHQNAGEERDQSCDDEDDEENGQNGVYVYYKNNKIKFPSNLYRRCRSNLKNCFHICHTAHTMKFKTLSMIYGTALKDSITYILQSKANPNNMNDNHRLECSHLKSQFLRLGQMLRNGDLDRYFSKTSTFGRSDEEEQVCVNTSNSTSNGSWQMAVSGYTASQSKTNRYTYMNNHNIWELINQFCCHKLAQKRQNKQRTYYIGPWGTDESVLSYEFVTDSSNAGQNFMLNMSAMFVKSTVVENDCTNNTDLADLFEHSMLAHNFVNANSTPPCYLIFDDMSYRKTVLVSTDVEHLATCAIFLTSAGYGAIDVLKLAPDVVYLTCFNFSLASKILGSLGLYISPITYLMVKQAKLLPLLDYGSLLTHVVPQITNSHTPKVIQGASNLRNMDDTFAIVEKDLANALPKTNTRSVLTCDPMPGCPIKNMAINKILTTTQLDPNVCEDGIAVHVDDAVKFGVVEFQHHMFEFVSVLNHSIVLKRRLKKAFKTRPVNVANNVKYKIQDNFDGFENSTVVSTESGKKIKSTRLSGHDPNVPQTVVVEAHVISKDEPLKLNETVVCLTNITKEIHTRRSKCFTVKHNKKINRCNIVFTRDVYADRESGIETYLQKGSIKLSVLNNGTVLLTFTTRSETPYENGDKVCTPSGQKVTGRLVAGDTQSHFCATSINRGDLGERIYGLAARLEEQGIIEVGFCSVFFGKNWVLMPPSDREKINKEIVKLAYANGGTQHVYSFCMSLKNKARDPKSFYVWENVKRHEYTHQINKGKSGCGSSNLPRSQFGLYIAQGAASVTNQMLESSIGPNRYRELDENYMTLTHKTTGAFFDTLNNLDTSVRLNQNGSYIENVMKLDGVWN